MEFLADLINYPHLARAAVTAVVIGIVSGVVGSLIILRGLSLMGDAISHAVMPGIADAKPKPKTTAQTPSKPCRRFRS